MKPRFGHEGDEVGCRWVARKEVGDQEKVKQDVGWWLGSRMQVDGLGEVRYTTQDVCAISTGCSSTNKIV